jgi:hypothetical protein
MEQRRLRLGDILDDYCPRERRVTNHAVVAMVGETVQQTRCTTCDAEHPFKGARLPRRRPKEPALYEQVLAGIPEAAGDVVPETPRPAEAAVEPAAERAAAAEAGNGDDPSAEPAIDAPGAVEDGPVHRPLIRATLPRPEGQPVERRPPDFTVRQATRNGGFRDHDPRGGRGARPSGNGGRPHRPGRPGRGPMQGAPRFDRPPIHGRHGRPGPPRHGKKRSR